ncbi:hypothetical protein ISG33_09795 [Glaciecola sp. MH2013]|uniref:hypothetical protein n=1 Tax=Glaciecola sp. MH2013 TaxID=2785524 RepID=UPI00189DE430|nr:hypothetical protein [Glaciecola sp. MH2013]MBF7073687.1 hypothetical protein [Glaciecola sp. MH2013]
MKTRINLYRDEFKPQFVWLSVTNTLLLSVVVLFVLLGIYYVSWSAMDARQTSLSELQASIKERQNTLDELTLQLSQRQKNPLLLRELEQRQFVLANVSRLAEKLDLLEETQRYPFSTAFESFSQANRDDLWLSSFYLSSEAQIIEGNITNAEALPAWLQTLGKTSYFANSNFDSASISTTSPVSAAGAQQHSAPTSGPLKFVLKNGQLTEHKGGQK